MQQEQSKLSDETRPGIACEIQIRKQGKYHYKFAKLLDEKFNSFDNGDEVIVLTPSEHEDLLQQSNVDNDIDIEKIHEDYMVKIRKQAKTIHDLKQMNDNLAKEKDAIEKQLDNSADASEIKDLENTIQDLKEKLATSEKNAEYWQKAHDSIFESSDELALQNESLISDNEKLRKDNNEINETNKLLNENLIATNKNFKETKQELQSDFKNKEKELKETIKKQQTHIDEITQKYQSLLVLKEHIPQKQHYDEINALKDEINTKQQEINKLNANIETSLATQKSDLEIAHADEINKIKIENTESKAQMLVAYNQDLNSLKVQYNNLANDYNNLLNGVDSLTRINTLVNGKHKQIKKDKEQIPLLEITSEQLPPSDENIIEFVPKD